MNSALASLTKRQTNEAKMSRPGQPYTEARGLRYVRRGTLRHPPRPRAVVPITLHQYQYISWELQMPSRSKQQIIPHLPNELLLKIIQYLPADDVLLSAVKVSTRWRSLISANLSRTQRLSMLLLEELQGRRTSLGSSPTDADYIIVRTRRLY